MPTCSKCPAKIIWAKMPSGKNNCFDFEPREDGTHALVTEGGVTRAVPMQAVAVAAGLFPGEPVPLYVSHFATCASANEFRRKK